MLPRRYRTPTSFFVGKPQGKKYYSPHLTLSVSRSSDAEPRFSFSISKKISKTAPERNLFRRRGYAIVHKLITITKPSHVFFFSARKDATKIPFTELESEVKGLLKQAGGLQVE